MFVLLLLRAHVIVTSPGQLHYVVITCGALPCVVVCLFVFLACETSFTYVFDGDYYVLEFIKPTIINLYLYPFYNGQMLLNLDDNS